MPSANTTRNLTRGALLLAIIALFALPHLYNVPADSPVRTQTLSSLGDFLLLLTLASSWNLFSGSTGLIDLGHTVFFGIGAYSVAVLMHHLHIPFPVAALGALLMGLMYGLGAGVILVRLRGGYFAIATFALLVLVRGIVSVARPITGGGIGLVVPLAYDSALYYYAALVCLLIVTACIVFIHRSALRMLLEAIRQDSIAASIRGIPVRRYWLLTYVIAGVFSAVVGSIWFYRHTAIDPESVFIETQSFELVAMVFIGGLGTISGPIIGGLLIYAILGGTAAEWRFIIEGLMLVIAVSYLPKGIIGLGITGLWHNRIQRTPSSNPANAKGTPDGQ